MSDSTVKTNDTAAQKHGAAMDERTLTALQSSIAKWEAIVNGTGVDHGADNCSLCDLFLAGDDACKGCPVFKITEMQCCNGSPYEEWADHHQARSRLSSRGEMRIYEDEPVTRAMAQSELDFLRSLLPSEQRSTASAGSEPSQAE